MELVPYLLKLLEGVGLETLENPSAIKAQIVKALKSMTRSLQFGEQVCVKCGLLRTIICFQVCFVINFVHPITFIIFSNHRFVGE